MPSSKDLLEFLSQLTALRSKQITAYGAKDLVRYLADMPLEAAECKSAFHNSSDEQAASLPWLKVKKPRFEKPPAVSEVLKPWVDPVMLEQPAQCPELLPTIVATELFEGADGESTVSVERKLEDFPEVAAEWSAFLDEKWRPWAEKRLRAEEIQVLYSDLDEMRRKAQEAADQYELLMAVGLLQWVDDKETKIERHVLVGHAEISLNAARGELTVEPAGDCSALRLESDMLPPGESFSTDVSSDLDELGPNASDVGGVVEVLQKAGNSWNPDVQVSGDFEKGPAGGPRPTLVFAPALVLRPRRTTAFAGVVQQLLGADEEDAGGEGSPWGQLLAEGATTAGGEWDDTKGGENISEPNQFPYFPLAVNLEQETILDRLRTSPGVLVKGPPGTGKSHTIANLICHLLAKGERVLVTAQAPKALAVLRGLLPECVQELCVTSLGGGREEQRVLEESVRGILDKKNEWQGKKSSAQKITALEERLANRRAEVLEIESHLRKVREAETIRTTLPGGYEGTAAAIARRLDVQRERFGWFPDEHVEGAVCPLDERMVRILRKAPELFPAAVVEDLSKYLGEKPFPDPLQFNSAVARLNASRTERSNRALQSSEVDDVDLEALEAAADSMRRIEAFVARAAITLGDTVSSILEDAAVGRLDRWSKTLEKARCLVSSLASHVQHLPLTAPKIDSDVDRDELLHDVQRRRAHFESGGATGFWIFAPQLVRETQYIVAQCRIARQPCATLEALRSLEAHLAVEAGIATLAQQFPRCEVGWATLGDGVDAWREHVEEYGHVIDGLLDLPPKWRDAIPPADVLKVASAEGRARLAETIANALAVRKARDLEKLVDRLRVQVAREASHPDAHPTLGQVLKAVEEHDVTAYTAAQSRHATLLQLRDQWRDYQRVLSLLDEQNPGLGPLLECELHSETWCEKIQDLPAAWAWAHACRRLRSTYGGIDDARLDERFARVRDDLESTMEKLVAEKAWAAFFSRLGGEAEQHLIAWQQAIKRLGKGTSKYANKYRNEARKHLAHCLSDMPAWVMPLHKLWETVAPKPGLFDTIIVDEASQAGVDSLVLFLLAKRIIVVGDDMQNSPDDVGVDQMQVNKLIRERLTDFAFGSQYRLDSSLFDHADRAFRSRVMLREHFRCVPEIIRFSNTFYGGRLVPLRVVPSGDRLDPLKHVYVEQGAAEGRDSRIQNAAEADAIVDTIAELIGDEEYAGKTMGVIALQGRAQAELISRKLAARVPASEIEGRRIRCGEPQNFQGDQRDVMFLSMVAAPNQNYTSRTTADDQRRYNVAMSRGRDQVWLFHSVTLEELSPLDMRYQLLSFFEAPTKPLPGDLDSDTVRQMARRPRELGNQPHPFESWFELDVCLELLDRGLRVQSQVEVGTRRLDLVVEGGGSRLAVECDGEHWHGPDAYAEDMARQRQLERAGWVFERVRESAFYADRNAAIEKVIAACNKLGIYAWSTRDSDVVGEEVNEQESMGEPAEDYILPNVEGDLAAFLFPMDGTCGDSDASIETPVALQRNDAVPFSGYSSGSGYPDPREASSSNIRARILEIVRQDGPLLRTSINRLYVSACPAVQRQGKDILRSLDSAISMLLRGGELQLENELDGAPEGQVIRLANSPKVRRRAVGLRDLEEIPPSEMMAELDDRRAELGEAFSNDLDECTTFLMQLYGGRKLTKKRGELLRRVVMRWIASRGV